MLKFASIIENNRRYFGYSEEIHNLIYTTNPVESFNQCMKVAKNKPKLWYDLFATCEYLFTIFIGYIFMNQFVTSVLRFKK